MIKIMVLPPFFRNQFELVDEQLLQDFELKESVSSQFIVNNDAYGVVFSFVT